MSVKLFLKENKKTKDNVFYPATESLLDESGKPLLWEIKALKTKELEAIREECVSMVQVKGKPNQKELAVDTRTLGAKINAACVVYPNLYDAELQDSYGVKNPEDLLREMIDDAGEYNSFSSFIQNFCNLTDDAEQKVEEVKN